MIDNTISTVSVRALAQKSVEEEDDQLIAKKTEGFGGAEAAIENLEKIEADEKKAQALA